MYKNLMIFVVVVALSASSCRASAGKTRGPERPGGFAAAGGAAGSEPYLGSYAVQDGCQYSVCGPDYSDQFGSQWGPGPGVTPRPGSCSGECDSLARRLIGSDRFKKEFLWGRCADMCLEKYPVDEYRYEKKGPIVVQYCLKQ